jgi:hypothetical protein
MQDGCGIAEQAGDRGDSNRTGNTTVKKTFGHGRSGFTPEKSGYIAGNALTYWVNYISGKLPFSG